MRLSETDSTPLDDAARAGWLYYVGGLTQDQIAAELGVSRQRAQRLVARAMTERLIHVRLEHPVSACLDLEAQLMRKYGLRLCRVALSLAEGMDPVQALAPTAAVEMERVLSGTEPLTIAFGTGRTLRATVEALTRMEAEQHKIVSLIGNIAPDGTASYYDVIIRIADKVRAPHFPMPIPVVADSPAERDQFLALKPVKRVIALARSAEITFVGIGQMTDSAPLMKDGFVTAQQLKDLRGRGAVGEIVSGIYDAQGQYLEVGHNDCTCGVRVSAADGRLVVGLAAGSEKLPAILGALRGRLINALITDERTARALLA